MKSFLIGREHYGNLGGLTHLAGNFCLLAKGLLAAILTKQVIDFHPLLTQWPSTLSGMIFLFTASLLVLYGHLTKGFLLSYGLALAGYLILGGDAILHHGSTATFLGLGIGVVSCLYVLVATTNVSLRFLSVHSRLANRRFRQFLRSSLERFPFWPSGIIEFIADSALLTGAVLTGDGAMVIIASFWTIGSLLLAGALPSPVKI